MTTLALPRDQEELREALHRVQDEGERVVLEQDGESLGALVSMDDLRFLEELEDRLDADAYRAAMKEWEQGGRETIPWEKIRDDLGL